MTTTADFAALHHGDKPLLLPNAWDFASGAALAEAGFAAIGTTSLGVAAAAGKPDATGETKPETVALARSLSRLPVPVTVDIEGGFSEDAAEVAELVAELASFGIAGVNLEDGRSDNTLVDLNHQAAVIEAIKAAAPDLFLNARTDTFWLSGDSAPSLPETLTRARAYAAAGADGIFVPGIALDDDIKAVLGGVDRPLNVLYMPGRTDFARLTELGVHRVSTGSLPFRAALHTAVTTVLEITGKAAGHPMPTYQEIQRLIGG
jgi:2-methylisocitrate lyase-like PEP mutase family enzyme